MEQILNIAKDYYLVFVILSIILILSLIGYLSDTLVSKDIKIKKKKEVIKEPEKQEDKNIELS